MLGCLLKFITGCGLEVKHYKCNKSGNAIKREDDICLTNFQTKADYFSFMPTKMQPENGWQVEETMHCSQHFSWIARKVVLTAFQSFWKTVCPGKWTFAKMRKKCEKEGASVSCFLEGSD